MQMRFSKANKNKPRDGLPKDKGRVLGEKGKFEVSFLVKFFVHF